MFCQSLSRILGTCWIKPATRAEERTNKPLIKNNQLYYYCFHFIVFSQYVSSIFISLMRLLLISFFNNDGLPSCRHRSSGFSIRSEDCVTTVWPLPVCVYPVVCVVCVYISNSQYRHGNLVHGTKLLRLGSNILFLVIKSNSTSTFYFCPIHV